MNFWAKIKGFFVKKPSELGALIDTRSEEEKKLDYHISEIVATASPVIWEEKAEGDIRTFGDQDQDGSGSCVAQSRRKLYRILFKVNRGYDIDFSASYIYRLRSNYPVSGMIASDAISICRNRGITLNALLPSDNMSDGQMNTLVIKSEHDDIAKVFQVPNEVIFTAGDLETVASTIQKTRKGVMVWFYFTGEEWSREVPTLINYSLNFTSPNALRHSVVAIEPALYNGNKGVWIDDSAHFGGLTRRFITEQFFKARNVWASYPINFKFEPGSNNTLRPTYDGSIVSLQNCLKFEGLFPANVESTGIYGPITTKAVKDFQVKYGIDQIGTVGPKTGAKLHELYP